MDDFEICLATKKDLQILNSLYSEMDDKPLMSEDKILEIWNQIQQIPDYYIYLAFLKERAIGCKKLY